MINFTFFGYPIYNQSSDAYKKVIDKIPIVEEEKNTRLSKWLVIKKE